MADRRLGETIGNGILDRCETHGQYPRHVLRQKHQPDGYATMLLAIAIALAPWPVHGESAPDSLLNPSPQGEPVAKAPRADILECCSVAVGRTRNMRCHAPAIVHFP